METAIQQNSIILKNLLKNAEVSVSLLRRIAK